VRGGALDGGVDGVAFGGAADGGVGIVDGGQGAAAAGEGADGAIGAGGGDGLVHVTPDAWVAFEVMADDIGGFGAGDAEALGEAEGGDAVRDAEVDHLGAASHFGG